MSRFEPLAIKKIMSAHRAEIGSAFAACRSAYTARKTWQIICKFRDASIMSCNQRSHCRTLAKWLSSTEGALDHTVITTHTRNSECVGVSTFQAMCIIIATQAHPRRWCRRVAELQLEYRPGTSCWCPYPHHES